MKRSDHSGRIPRIEGIDVDARPSSYWADESPIATIVQNVTGENRRRAVASSLDRGEAGAIGERLTADVLADSTRRSLGAIHPSFLGGEYLPEYMRGELEIARIVMASVTQDVISLRVHRRTRTGPYRYRMVDEYENLYRLRRKTSREPLTMGEVISLIDSAKSDGIMSRHRRLPEGILADQLYEGADGRDVAAFLEVSSAVYPQLRPYYRQRLREWLASR